ncbi:MAG: hypothetical protein B6D65_02035 [candidate division Zixibacteria bacterium 4484_93]|nr:MAG: hypothetical protein B6D65_02035 [candidate division Zixibacteria bacterium 4484_93]RKZ33424.1 MAG: hypothetical protein DRQ19_02915 [bacterium]
MIQELFPPHLPGRYDDLNASDILLEYTFTLRRNIRGNKFPARMSPSKRRSLADSLAQKIGQTHFGDEMYSVPFDELSPSEWRYLVERDFPARILSPSRDGVAAFISQDEKLSVLLCSRDHLTMRVSSPGKSGSSSYPRLFFIENALKDSFEFAFDEQFGYLTSDLLSCGTGFRAGVLLLIPGIIILKKFDLLKETMLRYNLQVGIFSPDSVLAEATTRASLGVSEEEIIDSATGFAEEIADVETRARKELMDVLPLEIQDRVMKSFGLATHSVLISLEEATGILNRLLIGAVLGMLKLDKTDILELFYLIKPEHIRALTGENLPLRELDMQRGKILRERLTG